MDIYSGKTKEEAIQNGLKALNISLEDAEIEILDEGKKGIFGIGGRPAQVKITKKVEEKVCLDISDSSRAVDFLKELFKHLNLDVEVSAEEEEKLITITLKSEKSSSLIGYRGEILDSLQTLAGAIANKGRESYRRVIVNCEGYREKREETLKSLAVKLADKAVSKGRKMKLEPMNPFERRIIHSTLADREDITTESEGKDPARYIVIIPKNLKPYAKKGYNNKGYSKSYNKGSSSEMKGKKSSGFGGAIFLGNSLKDGENKD